MAGAKEAGHTADKVFLREKEIKYCVACDYCQNHGGICTQKDDVDEIIDQMVEADVLILATPVYFYSLTAQMKALIDRTYSRYTEIKDKDIYYIMTAADNEEEAMDGTIHSLDGFARCLPGAEVKGKIVGIGAWAKGDIKKSPVMQEAYEMGQEI
jgi:multimeric flavodoxin WrbA